MQKTISAHGLVQKWKTLFFLPKVNINLSYLYHSRVFLQAGRSASQWGFGINQLKLSPVEHRYYTNIVKIVIIAITRIWFVILKYQDPKNL